MEISVIDKLPGLEFEVFVKTMLEALGFKSVKPTRKSGDYGADLIAEFNSNKYVIQTKRHNRGVGLKAVQEAFAGMKFYKAHFCMVVSNNYFTKEATELASACNCRLIGRKEIIKWLKEEFESPEKFLAFIEQQEIKKFKIPTVSLIHEYRILKVKLCRMPTISDVDKHGKFSSSVYRKRWGTWNNFLLSINEIPIQNKNISREDLKDNFFKVKHKLGKTPTIEEMRKLSKFSMSVYQRRFGGWNNFLESIDERVNKKQKIPKDQFISEFMRVKQKIGHAPTFKEMNKYGKIAPNSYKRIWGSWTNFLKEYGEKHQKRNIPEEDLIKAYLKCKKLLKKDSLMQSDMDNFGEFSSSVYIRRFGGWNKFLNRIGDKINYNTNISEDALISDYYRIKNLLNKKTVSCRDIRENSKFSLSIYLNRFGKWNNFLKEAEKHNLSLESQKS